MKYPDYDFYRSVFSGSEEEDIIMPFIREAGDILWGHIAKEDLSEGELSELFRAVCAQGEYLCASEGLSSVKLGDFSAEYLNMKDICPRAIAVLERAGLLFRGNVELLGVRG